MIDTKVLREKILDLAIRGKLVPQNPNDEPASVLLERIRKQKEQMVKEGRLKAKDIKNDTVIFKGEDNLHYEQFADGTMKCIEDEVPFELPEGWAWARLPVISSEIFAGGDKPDTFSKTLTNKCDIPVFSNGIDNLGLYGYTDIPRVCSNSLTISARGTIGFCCVRTEPFFPIIRLITIVPCKQINVHYLNIVFKALVESGVGSSIPQLTVPMIRTKLIPLPPQREQESISNCYDMVVPFLRLIEKEKQNISEIIIQTKSKILDLAIHGKLVPQDENDEPASVLLERIRTEKEELIKQGKIKRDKKESIIFRGEDNSYYEKIGEDIVCIDNLIPSNDPDNCEFVRFSSVLELLSGRDLKPGEYNASNCGIPYITGASNILDGAVCIERWTTSPQVITKLDDILITCKGTVGKIAVNNFGDAHIARQIMAIRNPYGLNSGYIKLCMEFYLVRLKNAAQGLIPGISRSDILDIILPIPPLQYQARVAETVLELNDILTRVGNNFNEYYSL